MKQATFFHETITDTTPGIVAALLARAATTTPPPAAPAPAQARPGEHRHVFGFYPYRDAA